MDEEVSDEAFRRQGVDFVDVEGCKGGEERGVVLEGQVLFRLGVFYLDERICVQ